MKQFLLITLFSYLNIFTFAQDRITGKAFATRSEVIAQHGMAIMSVREGLSFETTITSDTEQLFSLVETLQNERIDLHCLRDLTRGGLATSLVELAESASVSFEIDETLVQVQSVVRGACEFLGLDPFYSACEGRLIAFVSDEQVEKALSIMSRFSNAASIIGRVKEKSRHRVIAKTTVGTHRILDKLTGEQLPRIC